MSRLSVTGIFKARRGCSMYEIMWLIKIVCILVIANGSFGKEDELLDTLYGLEGRNKMSICVATARGRWRRCDGALYTRHGVVARAHCLAGLTAARAAAPMAAERLSAGGSCDRLAAGETGAFSSRAVQQLVMHPWLDLAIVAVRTPYHNLDKLANATEIRLKLRRHGVYKWMKYYFDAFALTHNQDYHLNRIARSIKTNRHPIWYFFVTMLLPSVLFMCFFIYIIFYTGKPCYS